eukprot:TRINITY_DN12341_c2_g2_i3.p1 TRINITY_DN12341_c2_g2~~TRINITY_DN12341_c2_g2_i3.p1  ORF type:complete len:330 (+),score=64.13 TRINITY_DN12341_c2_g2_i3:82-1071(+)
MAAPADARFFETKRGVKLHEVRGSIKSDRPKALVVLCHGYAHHVGNYMEVSRADTYVHEDILMLGCSHHGHGHSEGLRCYVAEYQHLVDDFCDYVESLMVEFPNVPIFIQAQSMGGAVALLSTAPGARLEGKVRALILLAPMCKISDDMQPPAWLIAIGEYIAWLFPTLPAAPVPSSMELSFKDKEAYERARTDPLGYQSKPRLMTAYQLREATLAVQAIMPRFTTPFIVMHGDHDQVTSLETSKALHEQAKSPVKELKVYKGMWHAMLSEPDGGAEMVRRILVVCAVAMAARLQLVFALVADFHNGIQVVEDIKRFIHRQLDKRSIAV